MKTTLITGANRGIGLEFCRQLSARGDQVIAVCRHSSDALAALPVRCIEGVDVTDVAALTRLRTELGEVSIDWLINNAGVLHRENDTEADYDQMRVQFEVNALGPVKVTRALKPLLARGGKVAIITSRMGSIADNTSGGYLGYRMSKAAVNMAGVCLAHELQSDGVALALLHPGYVRTDMTGGEGLINPDESVRGLVARIDALDAAHSGGFWHSDGESLSW